MAATQDRQEKAGTKAGRNRLILPVGRRYIRAFVNLPFHRSYSDLYLAYIVGLLAYGIWPVSILDAPGGAWRLAKLVEVIDQCEWSIHDLSYRSRTDVRYNMPFELGLAVALSFRTAHKFHVFEGERYHLLRTLSDLNGYDPLIHAFTPEGVLRELGNAFAHRNYGMNFKNLKALYERAWEWRRLQREKPEAMFEPSFLVKAVFAVDEICRAGLESA